MSDPLFSNQDNSPPNPNEENPPFKRPEFVLIDERQGRNQYTYFGSEASDQSKEFFQTKEDRAHSLKGPIFLRFICFLGFLFCLVFEFSMLFYALLLTFFSAISLFQNSSLNYKIFRLWKICIHTLVTAFGFILGLLSPTLGFGLIALYFSLVGDLVEENLLRKVIKRTFNHL